MRSGGTPVSEKSDVFRSSPFIVEVSTSTEYDSLPHFTPIVTVVEDIAALCVRLGMATDGE